MQRRRVPEQRLREWWRLAAYVGRDGKAGLLDWQAVRRGHPGRDIAYTLVTSTATAVAVTITAGLGGMQSEDIAHAGLRLAVAALADLETVAALRKVW